MTSKFSPESWEKILPNYREGFKGFRPLYEVEKNADVLTAVFLQERWGGVFRTDDFAIENAEELLFQAGRWCVRTGGIDCDETSYYIEKVRLGEEDWVAQLTEKLWLYDPSDMLDAFEFAYKSFFPADSKNDRAERMHRQIHNALARLEFPFLPSSTMGRHVYLPSRMHEAQRKAFCEFLSEEGYSPSF